MSWVIVENIIQLYQKSICDPFHHFDTSLFSYHDYQRGRKNEINAFSLLSAMYFISPFNFITLSNYYQLHYYDIGVIIMTTILQIRKQDLRG